MNFTTDVTLLVLSAFMLGVTLGMLIMGLVHFNKSLDQLDQPKD